MANLQLFIAVAVPTLAVLLHFSSTHVSLRRLEERLSRVEDRLDRFEDRFVRFEARLTSLEVSLANLRAELYEKFALKQA